MKILIYWMLILVVLGGWATVGCGAKEEPQSEPPIAEQAAPVDAPAAQTPPVEIAGTPELAAEVIAVVNGEQILRAEFAAYFQQAVQQIGDAATLDEYTKNRLKETALKEVIDQRLVAQKAREQQVSVSETDFQQAVQRVQAEYGGAEIQTILAEQGKSYDAWAVAQRQTILREKLVDVNMASMIVVTPEEIQQYYEQNKEKYDHSAEVRARQILTYDGTSASQALAEIRAGAAFDTVAQKYSESADASVGGDLGFFGAGVMPPEFDEVVFALKIGEISEVIQTPYGYQIFQLVEQRDARRVTLTEASAQIATLLQQQKRMLAMDLWLGELHNQAKLTLNQEALKQVN